MDVSNSERATRQALPWFRLYHRTVDDDRLRLLAFEDRWHFIALCCLKASGLLDEGDSQMRQRRIAVKLGVQTRELEEIGRRLIEVGLVYDDLTPCAWENLQSRSDISTERVRTFREKQRLSAMERDETVSGTVQKEIERERKRKIENTSPKGEDVHQDHENSAKLVLDHWNAMASRAAKVKGAKALNDARRKAIKARLREHSLEEIVTAIGTIPDSPFLIGKNDRGWTANFDWLLQPSSMMKLIEGAYHGNGRGKPSGWLKP